MNTLSSLRALYSAYIDVRLPDHTRTYAPGICDQIIQKTFIRIFAGEVLLATKTITGEDRFMYREMCGVDTHCFRVCPAYVVEELQQLGISPDKQLRIEIELTVVNSTVANGVTIEPTVTLFVPRLEIREEEPYA